MLFRSVFLVTHCALPGLRRGTKAHIFNIASGAARKGFEGCSIYCAMKAGLMGFSNGLREDLRSDGIRVSTVYPCSTDTTIFDGVPGDWDRDSMNKPEDVAEVLWSGLVDSGEAADLTVPALAERAGMSLRAFSRAFLAEVGETPARWVEGMRLDAARRALEAGAASIKSVAVRSGFGDDERMRRAFLRRLDRVSKEPRRHRG